MVNTKIRLIIFYAAVILEPPKINSVTVSIVSPYLTVQFSRSVVSNAWQPYESQHARPPCPSPNPRVHSDLCPSSQWCHPAISSKVVPFSSCPQSLPASESFPVSQLFAWGGQSTGVSALASFLPKISQGWSPCSPRDSQESSPTPQLKSINSSVLSLLHSPTLTSIHRHLKRKMWKWNFAVSLHTCSLFRISSPHKWCHHQCNCSSLQPSNYEQVLPYLLHSFVQLTFTVDSHYLRQLYAMKLLRIPV